MSYFEQCVEAIESIDVVALAATYPEKSSNYGGGYNFCYLDEFSLRGTDQHVGMKGPIHDAEYPKLRLLQELSFIDFCMLVSPDLSPLVPRFMGVVAVERSSAKVFLTEEASHRGALSVRSITAPQAVRELLYTPFAEVGTIEEVMSSDELNRTVAFNVGGMVRLLDFTPLPVNYSKLEASKPFDSHKKFLGGKLSELEIVLPQDTILGQYIRDNYTF